jgi:uncharacterized protein
MIPRILDAQLQALLRLFPAVTLLGPRQSGKTTLARTFSKRYFDLENMRDRTRLELEWETLIHQDTLLILDEAQNMPDVFRWLRSAIDDRRKVNGRFLILGSVSPSLMKEVSESLAGRSSVLEMAPLSAAELPASLHDSLCFCGGYPDGGVLDPEQATYPVWQKSYLQKLAERDLPAWGLPSKHAQTMRLLELTAAHHGCQINYSKLGQGLGLSYHTVQSHLDYLEGAYLIRRLQPYFVNNFPKRLTKAPKLYWRDTGLLHVLLGMHKTNPMNLQQWAVQPWAGESWEGWAIEQIIATRTALGESFKAWYFRTNDGLECDLIIESGNEREVIEIKLAATPASEDFRKLEKIANLINATRQVMITRVVDAYTVTSGSRWSVNLATYLAQFTPRATASVLPAALRMQQTYTVDFLHRKLVEAAGAMVERGILTSERLKQRAIWLNQDLQALEWDDSFRILPTQVINTPGMGMIPLVEYEWGQNQFSINKAKPLIKPASAEQAEGTFLSGEDLGWLGRISEIGHTLIPHLWLKDKRLRQDVSERNQHLDTLQEVWWLSVWKGLDSDSVQREFLLRRDDENLSKPSPSTIDWRFEFTGLPPRLAVNLSVKNRKRTALHIPHNKKRLNLFDSNDSSPFAPSGPDEINVLAITAYHGGVLTANEQRELAMAFLKKNQTVDAVAISLRISYGRPTPGTLGDGIHLYFPEDRPLHRKDQMLRVLCNQDIAIEDSAAVGILKHSIDLEDFIESDPKSRRIITG